MSLVGGLRQAVALTREAADEAERMRDAMREAVPGVTGEPGAGGVTPGGDMNVTFNIDGLGGPIGGPVGGAIGGGLAATVAAASLTNPAAPNGLGPIGGAGLLSSSGGGGGGNTLVGGGGGGVLGTMSSGGGGGGGNSRTLPADYIADRVARNLEFRRMGGAGAPPGGISKDAEYIGSRLDQLLKIMSGDGGAGFRGGL